MSKSIKTAFCNKTYKTLLQNISCIIFNNEVDIFNVQQSKSISDWWKGSSPYLNITHDVVKGFSLRLYRSDFKKSGKTIKAINSRQQGTVYLRYRNKVDQKLNTIQLGAFNPSNYSQFRNKAQDILAANQLHITDFKLSTKANMVCQTSLLEFLEEDFYQEKLNQNPKTVDKKVKVIKRYFKDYLELPLNGINAALVLQWLKLKERKLTTKQISAGEHRWSLKPSTLKEAVCTLRSCINLAKTKQVISEHDLYTLPAFKMDNEIIRYLSEEEELKLYSALNHRNFLRLEERERTIEHRRLRGRIPPYSLSGCAFADHVTPFIVLFKETGIRPGTLMNSKWSDVDLNARYFRIRKSIDKKSLSNHIPLNDLAYKTLVEWKKHHIHNECKKFIVKASDCWLFPSSQNPENQLTTIKTAWKSLIKNAGIECFRFYDLRHDFASKVMMQTGNIYLVSHLLNHRQIETTKRYAHLMDESKVEAVKTLDKNRSSKATPFNLID